MSFRPILPKPENYNTVMSTTTSGVILSPQLSEDMKFQVQKLEFVDSSFENNVAGNENENVSLSPTSEVILDNFFDLK